jgi:hypothetical protein
VSAYSERLEAFENKLTVDLRNKNTVACRKFCIKVLYDLCSFT